MKASSGHGPWDPNLVASLMPPTLSMLLAAPEKVIAKVPLQHSAESEIEMVDGCFMVEGPCVNHAEKAVNHVLWLTEILGRWLTEPCLVSMFELSGHQFGTILNLFALTFQSASI